jgi:hypothetical protein
MQQLDLMAVTELLPLEGLTVWVLHHSRTNKGETVELESGTNFPGRKALLKTLL